MAQVLIAAIPGNILYSHVPCKKVVFFVLFLICQGVKVAQMRLERAPIF